MKEVKIPLSVGIVSYNMYCNFTNYGSALQSWALYQTVERMFDSRGGLLPYLVDYCPNILADVNPLDPFARMWDKDEETRKMCELSLPAIRENYEKFTRFYAERFRRTSRRYVSENFNSIAEEGIERFLCGSDTIFCKDEFGFDDGYYANFPVMRKRSVAYAASFGDTRFQSEDYPRLEGLIQNFIALGLRESSMLDYVRTHTNVPVKRVLDPTLLLQFADYDTLAVPRQFQKPYLLLYSRRYNQDMDAYAEKLACARGWSVVEISLRVTNAQKGRCMRYDAGVEEFLSLVKHAEYLVTNSYHGMIFAFQYRRPVSIFSREQGNVKITGLLSLLDMKERISASNRAETPFCVVDETDYDRLHGVIEQERTQSLRFLQSELQWLNGNEGGKQSVS